MLKIKINLDCQVILSSDYISWMSIFQLYFTFPNVICSIILVKYFHKKICYLRFLVSKKLSRCFWLPLKWNTVKDVWKEWSWHTRNARENWKENLQNLNVWRLAFMFFVMFLCYAYVWMLWWKDIYVVSNITIIIKKVHFASFFTIYFTTLLDMDGFTIFVYKSRFTSYTEIQKLEISFI